MLVSYGLGSYDCEGFAQREGGFENGGTSRDVDPEEGSESAGLDTLD
jgi:hypothetical protein